VAGRPESGWTLLGEEKYLLLLSGLETLTAQPVTRCYTYYTVTARDTKLCEPKYRKQGTQRELENRFHHQYTSEYFIVFGIMKRNGFHNVVWTMHVYQVTAYQLV